MTMVNVQPEVTVAIFEVKKCFHKIDDGSSTISAEKIVVNFFRLLFAQIMMKIERLKSIRN